jgi:glycosyltransferase involved in cell wall biosynthesis
MFVSVIVTCYNQEKFIVETINSVLKQIYSDFECIIINDGSTDSSALIIQNLIDGIPNFNLHTIKNSGVVTARNYGVGLSKGFFILPLDGDDTIEPAFISTCVARFIGNRDLKLVYSRCSFFYGRSGIWDLEPYSFECLLRNNMIPSTAMFLKSDFLRVGGYKVNMDKGLEDWDLWVRLLKSYNDDVVCLIDEYLFNYRIHKGTRSSEVNKLNVFDKYADLVLYNNFSVFQEYYGPIHNKLLRYSYLEKMFDKPILKFVVVVMNSLSVLKKKIQTRCNFFCQS